MPRILWVLIATQVVVATFFYGLPSLGTALRGEYGISLAQTGLVMAAPTAGLAISYIAWGLVGDRFGERIPLPSGMVLAGVGCAIAATAATTTQTIVGLFVAGLGGAANTLCSRAAAAVVPRARRGEALSALVTSLSIGGAVGSLAFPPLDALGGLSAPFWAATIGCLTVAAALALLLPQTQHGRGSSEAGRGPAHAFAPAVWRISIATGASMFGGIALLAFLPVFLVEEHGWSAYQAAGMLAAAFVLTGASRLAFGRASDRSGRRARPAAGLEVATIVLALLLAVSAPAPSIVIAVLLTAAIVVGLSNNGLTSALVADVADPARRGRALALRLTCAYLGSTLAPPLMGVAAGAIGWHPAFALAAIGPAVCCVLLRPSIRAEAALATA